jgi:hypothetical protein
MTREALDELESSWSSSTSLESVVFFLNRDF